MNCLDRLLHLYCSLMGFVKHGHSIDKQYQLDKRFIPAYGLYCVIELVADLAFDTAMHSLKLLIDENKPTEAPMGEYYIWIIEWVTQRIVAGMAPNIVQAHQQITYVPIERP